MGHCKRCFRQEGLYFRTLFLSRQRLCSNAQQAMMLNLDGPLGLLIVKLASIFSFSQMLVQQLNKPLSDANYYISPRSGVRMPIAASRQG